ncbi:hypothetical protein NP493_11g14007 [Ridgeia piscesae]|uniref:Galaxin-like repeats domain-containing protein n=1 Tax=Ridgeia piscesae TaxID=27915 RepID=A0AAD9PFC7_RIDPI|nr:hypothetical protein NP493_11g14007 [Ridgeia piscesae]
MLPSCHTIWFIRTQCSSKPFNRHTHVCCEDVLHKRPSEWRYVFCCGSSIYNPKTHMCCGTRIVSTLAMKGHVIICPKFDEEP